MLAIVDQVITEKHTLEKEPHLQLFQLLRLGFRHCANIQAKNMHLQPAVCYRSGADIFGPGCYPSLECL
jgi:hypothetical protein